MCTVGWKRLVGEGPDETVRLRKWYRLTTGRGPELSLEIFRRLEGEERSDAIEGLRLEGRRSNSCRGGEGVKGVSGEEMLLLVRDSGVLCRGVEGSASSVFHCNEPLGVTVGVGTISGNRELSPWLG